MQKKENTRQKIISAALKVFNENGYEGSTTNLIAQQACVNELTLFRHFKNKKNLIMEMIKQFSPINHIQKIINRELKGDLKDDLIHIGLTYIDIMVSQSKGVIMGLSAALRIPEMREIYINTPADQEKILIDYFEKQKNNMEIKNIDTHIAAQMFNEMLFGLSIRISIMGNKKMNKNSIKNIVIQFIDIFINGIIKK